MISRLRDAIRGFMAKPSIDEADTKALIKEIQRTLISSDVEVPFVLELTKHLEERLKSDVLEGLPLKQRIIKIIYEELTSHFGEAFTPPIGKQKIMLLGLYGSGKTTTAGKLALFYSKRGLSVAVASLDTERPAGQEQLKQLAEKANAHYYPLEDVEKLLKEGKEDVKIIDTAGKNALDEELLKLVEEQYSLVSPDIVYLVLPADIGKVASRQIEAFSSAVPITAAIITRFEGSGKAGGALAALAKRGIPIAFLGTGEKLDALEPYDAKRFVSKLLGLPDIEGLLQKAKELELQQSDELNLETFLQQLKAAKDMGPLSQVAGMMGMYDLPKDVLLQGEERLKKYEAIIQSMTPEERRNPHTIKGNRSRINRIARGAGVPPEEVNRLLNEYFKMEKLVKKLQRDKGMLKKLQKMIPGFKMG